MMNRNEKGKFTGGDGYWKGKKMGAMSEEQKKKIGKALKGKLPKNNIGKLRYWLGKKRPNLHSEETKKKLSDLHKGNKSPLWKGGKMKDYPEIVKIRKSLEYKEWRKMIFKRDDYTCKFCGQKGGILNADHIKRFSDNPNLRFDLSNGRTLCINCHRKTDTYGRRKKVALITGISGQDGSYMAELLLNKKYLVHGLIRRSSAGNTRRIDHILDKITLHMGDLSDVNNLVKILQEVQPDEIFNFAAMSQVRISYDIPAYTGMVTGLGFANLIEAMRLVCPNAKIYQASSSEMFGKVLEVPQRETTPFYPRSPYGCAKAYAFYLGRAYREGYGLKVYNGILFNHESPRRGEEFLSKKVVKAAVRIKKGLQDKLELGNLEAKRDIGYAKEYVYWIWKMVQGEPDDYVIATGETHSMEEFVEETFKYLGLNWKDYVVIDEKLKRPAEVDYLQGDPTKAKEKLGYKVGTTFKELIKIMVDDEMNA